MKHPGRQLILGTLLLIVGAFILIAIVRQQRLSEVAALPAPTQLQAQTAATPAKPDAIQGDPNELQIPSLNLDLAVVPGVYNPVSKTWTLTLNKVQFATMTTPPNTDAGLTFIYGHARKDVLGTLHNMQVGETAVIKTSNNHRFYYQLASVRVTNPNDSGFLSYTGKPILIIQTCSGLFYQDRQLFTFNLLRAE